jgi:hypothetical protein
LDAKSRTHKNGESEMNNIVHNVRADIVNLPEIATSVGLAASSKQQEVGGIVCLGIASTIAVYMMA